MSADREMDHLENMSGMNGSRHWNQPYCYATTDEQDAEFVNDGHDRNGGVPCEGNGERLLAESPSTFEQSVRSAVASLSVTSVSQIREVRK